MIETKNWNDNCEKFREMFHFELKDVSEIAVYQWKILISLDIFKFEERMKKKWYKEDKSLKDFVKETYWEEANILIDKLL
jgi:hypothetical protein